MVTVCAPAATDEAAVTVTVDVLPGEIEVALKPTVTPVGALAVKATAFFAVPLSVTLSVNAVDLPADAVPLVADGVSVKSVLETVPLPGQLLTKTAPSTDPSPVDRL